MTTAPAGIERRVGQRFPYLLPLSLRQPDCSLDGVGFTQDLSSRGVFFFTDAPLREGAEIELTLRMPSEITLGENMPVRCRGRVLRVVRPAVAPAPDASASVRAALEPRRQPRRQPRRGSAFGSFFRPFHSGLAPAFRLTQGQNSNPTTFVPQIAFSSSLSCHTMTPTEVNNQLLTVSSSPPRC